MNPAYHPSSWSGTETRGPKTRCRGCPVLKSGLFSALKSSSKKLVSCLMAPGKYRKRQILYQEGNPSTRVYGLKSGFVKTFKTHPWGKAQLLEVLKPGDIFNLESLFGESCSVSAEVLTDSEICFFESTRMLETAGRNSRLALEIIRLLSRSLVESQKRLLDFGTKSAKARLAAFLLELLPAEAGAAGKSSAIRLPLSRREIADLIGVRLETTSRLFKQLREKKIAASNRRQVRVYDVERLRAMAELFH